MNFITRFLDRATRYTDSPRADQGRAYAIHRVRGPIQPGDTLDLAFVQKLLHLNAGYRAQITQLNKKLAKRRRQAAMLRLKMVQATPVDFEFRVTATNADGLTTSDSTIHDWDQCGFVGGISDSFAPDPGRPLTAAQQVVPPVVTIAASDMHYGTIKPGHSFPEALLGDMIEDGSPVTPYLKKDAITPESAVSFAQPVDWGHLLLQLATQAEALIDLPGVGVVAGATPAGELTLQLLERLVEKARATQSVGQTT